MTRTREDVLKDAEGWIKNDPEGIIAELSALVREGGWQPISKRKINDCNFIGCIEYAPNKFGQPFECVYDWDKEKFYSTRITELAPHEPTHFTEFPTPPKKEG